MQELAKRQEKVICRVQICMCKIYIVLQNPENVREYTDLFFFSQPFLKIKSCKTGLVLLPKTKSKAPVQLCSIQELKSRKEFRALDSSCGRGGLKQKQGSSENSLPEDHVRPRAASSCIPPLQLAEL